MVVPHSPRRPTHTPLRELSPSEAVDGDDWGSSPSTLARTVASGPPPRPGFTHPPEGFGSSTAPDRPTVSPAGTTHDQRQPESPRRHHHEPDTSAHSDQPASAQSRPCPRPHPGPPARRQHRSPRLSPIPAMPPGHTQDHQPDANTDQPASAQSGPSPPAHSRSPARYRRPHRSTRHSPAGAMLPLSAPAASPASAPTRITRPSAPAHRVRRRTPRRSRRSPGAGWSAAARRPGPWPRSGSAPRAGG